MIIAAPDWKAVGSEIGGNANALFGAVHPNVVSWYAEGFRDSKKKRGLAELV